MAADGVDYLALSGHKLYAPFGAGALVGRPRLARRRGAVPGRRRRRPLRRHRDACSGPSRPTARRRARRTWSARSPWASACRTLQAADRRRPRGVRDTSWSATPPRGSPRFPGSRPLRLWAPGIRGSACCRSPSTGVPYAQVAAALSAEYGIGVRHGCFCAHPLVAHLLDIDAAADRAHPDGARPRPAARSPGRGPGQRRARPRPPTTWIGCRRADRARRPTVRAGPTVSSPDGTDCRPDPDPRPWPQLPVDLG